MCRRRVVFRPLLGTTNVSPLANNAGGSVREATRYNTETVAYQKEFKVSNEDIDDPSVMDRSSARQYLVFGLLLGTPSCLAVLLGIVLLIADIKKNNLVSSLSMIGVGAFNTALAVLLFLSGYKALKPQEEK